MICTSRENEVTGNSSLRQNGTKSPSPASLLLRHRLSRECQPDGDRRDGGGGLFRPPAVSTAAPHALLFSVLAFYRPRHHSLHEAFSNHHLNETKTEERCHSQSKMFSTLQGWEGDS